MIKCQPGHFSFSIILFTSIYGIKECFPTLSFQKRFFLVQKIFDNTSLDTPSPSTSVTYFRKPFKCFSCKSNSIIRHSRDPSLFIGNGGVTDYRILSVVAFFDAIRRRKALGSLSLDVNSCETIVYKKVLSLFYYDAWLKTYLYIIYKFNA